MCTEKDNDYDAKWGCFLTEIRFNVDLSPFPDSSLILITPITNLTRTSAKERFGFLSLEQGLVKGSVPFRSDLVLVFMEEANI